MLPVAATHAPPRGVVIRARGPAAWALAVLKAGLGGGEDARQDDLDWKRSAARHWGTKVMVNNFQRPGAISNAAVGSDFEAKAQKWFFNKGCPAPEETMVWRSVFPRRRRGKFDLGSSEPPVLVECKSHKWTGGGNVPSAKITVWNESMYYFKLAPPGFRKVLFVLWDFSEKRGESLAEYYVPGTTSHLIPDDVEILEYDMSNMTAAVRFKARVAPLGTFEVGADPPDRLRHRPDLIPHIRLAPVLDAAGLTIHDGTGYTERTGQPHAGRR